MVPMVVLTSVQNTVSAQDLGAASAMVTFARSIGAAFGVAIFGSLLTGNFADRLHDLPVSGAVDPSRPETIALLPPAVRESALDAFAHATGSGFLWLTPLVIAGTLLALLLKPGRNDVAAAPTTGTIRETVQDPVLAA